MSRSIVKGILGGLGVVLLWSSFSLALNTWKVSDFSGDVSLGRGNERIAAAVGLDIAAGDTLTIGGRAWIELVSTGTCEEWELEGSRRYSFTEHEIMSSPEGDRIPPDHRLSVCFDPAGFSTGKAQRIGGIIERGESAEDELAEIGSKSNAALINLIILYALSDGNMEKAVPYYDELKKRVPGSEFVAGVAKIFEEKTPAGK
ncbi:MAG: hypothetical protein ACLPUX_01725 [Syntrophobacteraceae bacterium]